MTTPAPVFTLAPERFDLGESALLFTVRTGAPWRRFEGKMLDLWRRQAGSRASLTFGGAGLRFRHDGQDRRLQVTVKDFPVSLDGRPLADVLADHLNLYAQDVLAEIAQEDRAEEERKRREAEALERERVRLAAMCGESA